MSAWYVAALASPIWLAVLIIAIVMLTPLRRQARQSASMRNRITVIVGVVSLLIEFLCITALFSGIVAVVAEFYWRSNQIYEKQISAENLPHLDAAYRELWLRQMIPYALRPLCLTSAAACAQADELIHFARSDAKPGEAATGRDSWVASLVITVWLALIEVGLFRFLTRPARPSPTSALSEAGQA